MGVNGPQCFELNVQNKIKDYEEQRQPQLNKKNKETTKQKRKTSQGGLNALILVVSFAVLNLCLNHHKKIICVEKRTNKWELNRRMDGRTSSTTLSELFGQVFEFISF